ncbi:MAG: N-acetyltransferase family protein [Erythrobacter sp.]
MSALPLVVRAAEPGDAPHLLPLIGAHAQFEGTVASVTLEELAALLATEQPPTRIMVAARGGHLLGYAAMTYDFSLWRARIWAHLDCLFVVETARGQGVGAHLLDAAITYARNTKADEIEWQTPLDNAPAIAFYRHHGASSAPKMRFKFALAHKE